MDEVDITLKKIRELSEEYTKIKIRNKPAAISVDTLALSLGINVNRLMFILRLLEADGKIIYNRPEPPKPGSKRKTLLGTVVLITAT